MAKRHEVIVAPVYDAFDSTFGANSDRLDIRPTKLLLGVCSAMIGEVGPSSVVTEYLRRIDGSAMISSFSRDLSVARDDRVSLPCRSIGQPVPSLNWPYK